MHTQPGRLSVERKFKMEIDLLSRVLALWANWRATHLAVKTGAHFNQLETRSRAAGRNILGQTTKETNKQMKHSGTNNKEINKHTNKQRKHFGARQQRCSWNSNLYQPLVMRQPPRRPSSKFLQTFYCPLLLLLLHARKQGSTVRRASPISRIWYFFRQHLKQLWARSGITLKTNLYKTIQVGVCMFSIGSYGCTVYTHKPFLVCNVKSPVFVLTPLLGLLRSNKLGEFLPKFKWKSRVHCSGYLPPLLACISLLFCVSPIYGHT